MHVDEKKGGDGDEESIWVVNLATYAQSSQNYWWWVMEVVCVGGCEEKQ